ncbi:MAG: hypothetical protein B6U95_01360 [Thermofilum sp. ex4484_82]|nr:MAG: hypothetical protein B6U95_01360 [Thermofilum sp. ex4484_82]OYT39741.1 MAG: hypothetical protein B6U96_01365 [Archaeoglobales archaeon ex4484_92]
MEKEKAKLKALIRHWIEHTREHGKNFKKWSEKADEMKMVKTSEYLLKAAEATEKTIEYLEKACREVDA